VKLSADQIKHANTVARVMVCISNAYAFHLDGGASEVTEKIGKAAMRRIGALVLRDIANPGAKGVPFHNLDGMLRYVEVNKQASQATLALVKDMNLTDLIGACTVEAWRALHATIVQRATLAQTLRKVETERTQTCAEPAKA